MYDKQTSNVVNVQLFPLLADNLSLHLEPDGNIPLNKRVIISETIWQHCNTSAYNLIINIIKIYLKYSCSENMIELDMYHL